MRHGQGTSGEGERFGRSCPSSILLRYPCLDQSSYLPTKGSQISSSHCVGCVGDEDLVCRPHHHQAGRGTQSLCMGGKVGVSQTSACNWVSSQFLCRAQRRRTRKERRSTCICTSSSSPSGKACPGQTGIPGGSCPSHPHIPQTFMGAFKL